MEEGDAGGKVGLRGFEVGLGFLLAECACSNCSTASLETGLEF